jgi:protein subunit release factor A
MTNLERTVEIRAAEGGEDARLFVVELAAAYLSMAHRLG